MNISQRIILIIALALTAIIAIGGYAVLQSRHDAAEVRFVTGKIVPTALASSDLVSRIKDVQLGVNVLVAETNPALLPQLRDQLLAKLDPLKESLKIQESGANDPKQRAIVEETKETLAGYVDAINETIRLKLAGQHELANANLFGNVAPIQTAMESIVEAIRVEKNRAKDDAIASLAKRLSATTQATAGATALMVVLLGVVGLLLYRQITRPISRMQVEMGEIAHSQDFTRRVPVERKDEIGNSIIAFNSMIEKIQESSEQLKQKTLDIQSMLQNMPQGILTVIPGNRIHHEYSAYLEQILETPDIAGRDLMDLIFSSTNLGTDSLSQIETACSACVGEDSMNFAFNEHLLAGEIQKSMPDGRVKFLDLNWSPITDENDVTVRLMLCVRDVTELRALAAEAQQQKRELEIIGEILAVTQEKFHEFIDSAIRFIDENERVIRAHDAFDPGAVALLFRNMHTIKGNARTYGLRHLTDTVHDAEQTYDELRKQRPSLAWDQTQLLDELSRVKASIEHYAKINSVSLGRRGPGRRAGVERFLMVDREQIAETLHRLEEVNAGNIHELLAARDAVRRTLRLLGTEPIGKVLDGVLASLPSLAQDLGKLPPMVEIEDNDIVLRNQVGGMVKNVFTHLIRNSMDHGLEAPEERKAAGKALAGTLSIRLDIADGMLAIKLRDDGRGLALEKIREKATSVGLIHASRTLDDEEAAQLVFSSGLSTANAVTDVSGRGVGMEAALEFIKAEHGSIEIRFTDDRKGAPFRHFETVILLPAAVCERVDGLHGDGAIGARQAPMANTAASASADPTNTVGSRA